MLAWDMNKIPFILLALFLLGGASHKGQPKEYTNSLGLEFVWIAPGEFMMGSTFEERSENKDETPKHRVILTRGFYLGKYEVTFAQWHRVMGKMPEWHELQVWENKTKLTLPIYLASFDEVQAFIKKLNQLKKGKGSYRLPTEAEWEYACKAGSKGDFAHPAQIKTLNEYANYTVGEYGNDPIPIGRKKPNDWGLYDMMGNANEWIMEMFDAGFYGRSPLKDPIGPLKKEEIQELNSPIGSVIRAPRGGKSISHYEMIACSSRADGYHKSGDAGFRLVYHPVPAGSGKK